MIENYQDEQALEPMEPQDATFATITEIQDEGVRLKFDGNEEPSRKLYLTNSFAVFAEGDRVRVVKDSGTYVVEYPVGPPRKIMTADVATEAERAIVATNAETADVASTAANAQKADTSTYCQNGHNGGALGFFGTNPKSRYTCNSHSFSLQYCPSNAVLTTVISYHNNVAASHKDLSDKYNALLAALDSRGYGLVN